MGRKIEPQKEKLHIFETEKEVTKAILGDIFQEVKERKREMEDNLIALNEALRSPN